MAGSEPGTVAVYTQTTANTGDTAPPEQPQIRWAHQSFSNEMTQERIQVLRDVVRNHMADFQSDLAEHRVSFEDFMATRARRRRGEYMTALSTDSIRMRIKEKAIFKDRNIFAEKKKGAYVVYSYGRHFPMFACINNEWFINKDKYSRTTSRQQSRFEPDVPKKYKITTTQLKTLLE